ncbi:MAG: glycosyltransferase [Bacteroidia bacterium]
MSPIELILLAVAGFTTLILLYYYLLIFSKINRKSIPTSGDFPAVSIVIAARNEKTNLENKLPLILEQDYSNFEVVVINDGSYDGTSDLLKDFKLRYPHLKVVDLNLDERYRKGKKFAITMGIKAASFDQLLFTDADCVPASNQWIKQMMQAKGDKPIVLGFAPLKHKIGLLGAISYYETFHTALQYLSYAIKGKTYMAVGRNMSYTKKLFFDNKGFATHQHLLSGDDDLFIQEVATKNNVSICLEQDSFMISDAPRKWSKYIKQKGRHLSTSEFYKTKYKRMLGMYSIAHIVLYVSLAICLLYEATYIYAASILAFKWIVQWIVFFKPAMKLRSKFVAFFLPFYDICYTLYLLLFSLLKPFIGTKKWK